MEKDIAGQEEEEAKEKPATKKKKKKTEKVDKSKEEEKDTPPSPQKKAAPRKRKAKAVESSSKDETTTNESNTSEPEPAQPQEESVVENPVEDVQLNNLGDAAPDASFDEPPSPPKMARAEPEVVPALSPEPQPQPLVDQRPPEESPVLGERKSTAEDSDDDTVPYSDFKGEDPVVVSTQECGPLSSMPPVVNNPEAEPNVPAAPVVPATPPVESFNPVSVANPVSRPEVYTPKSIEKSPRRSSSGSGKKSNKRYDMKFKVDKSRNRTPPKDEAKQTKMSAIFGGDDPYAFKDDDDDDGQQLFMLKKGLRMDSIPNKMAAMADQYGLPPEHMMHNLANLTHQVPNVTNLHAPPMHPDFQDAYMREVDYANTNPYQNHLQDSVPGMPQGHNQGHTLDPAMAMSQQQQIQQQQMQPPVQQLQSPGQQQHQQQLQSPQQQLQSPAQQHQMQSPAQHQMQSPAQHQMQSPAQQQLQSPQQQLQQQQLQSPAQQQLQSPAQQQLQSPVQQQECEAAGMRQDFRKDNLMDQADDPITGMCVDSELGLRNDNDDSNIDNTVNHLNMV